ncbi:Cytochrome c-type biogenesis protein CcmB [Vreelandella titanicae BH1]|uniref:Heme exporter protein B n=2 Tax=Oceanospirillales TaxID=135619 RepID=L9UBE8_9GAMM|nr:Cytochrome c-type biogenesis protein CcmB [Halomonas titanicae BH1]
MSWMTKVAPREGFTAPSRKPPLGTDACMVEEKGLHSSLHGSSNSSSQSSETTQQVSAVPLREHNGGLMTAVKATLVRDLTLLLRRRGEVLNPLVFFALVITLFPIAISPDPELLAVIAPGLLWVAALLAALLSLDSLFRSDYDDGSLEQLLLAPQPLVALSLAKVAVHWLLTGLPLALMAPILGIMLALPAGSYAVLALSLALGTASLSLIGAIGAALTVGLARGGVLLSLLVLPLYIPVLIFGAGAVQAAIFGEGVSAHLAILGALLAASLMLAPWAIAASLRISING